MQLRRALRACPRILCTAAIRSAACRLSSCRATASPAQPPAASPPPLPVSSPARASSSGEPAVALVSAAAAATAAAAVAGDSSSSSSGGGGGASSSVSSTPLEATAPSAVGAALSAPTAIGVLGMDKSRQCRRGRAVRTRQQPATRAAAGLLGCRPEAHAATSARTQVFIPARSTGGGTAGCLPSQQETKGLPCALRPCSHIGHSWRLRKTCITKTAANMDATPATAAADVGVMRSTQLH